MMSKNRRILMIAIGILVLFGGAFIFNSYFALLGILPILVGATGFCPACYFLGKCRLKR